MLTYSLTVGGGYGFLTGRHGLTIDNLVNAVVVLANGDIVKANAEENQDVRPPDLIRQTFWSADNIALLRYSRRRIQFWRNHHLRSRSPLHAANLLER